MGEEVYVGRIRFADRLESAPLISCYITSALFVLHCIIASSLPMFSEKTNDCTVL